MEIEESDQAGLVNLALMSHLNSEGHNGKIKKDCEFCQAFLKKDTNSFSYQSAKFIIFDVSEAQPLINNIKIVNETKTLNKST